MNFWRRLFKGRDLKDALNQTRTFKVEGVRFTIRKISPVDFMRGSTSFSPSGYDKYEVKKPKKLSESDAKKLNKYIADVIVDGVVSPPLSRKDGEDGKVWVDEVMKNDAMSSVVFKKIYEYSFGQKKKILFF